MPSVPDANGSLRNGDLEPHGSPHLGALVLTPAPAYQKYRMVNQEVSKACILCSELLER